MMSSLLIIVFAFIYVCANIAVLILYMYLNSYTPPTYDDILIMLVIGLPIFVAAYLIGGLDWIYRKLCVWKYKLHRKIRH